MYEINTKFKSQVRHNFATFILRKSVSILGFWISAFSILMVLVILLENVFKLSIYLDIYISVCGHFARPKCRGISVKDFKFLL